MIKTYKQAVAVQDRRADSGKRGYAKAVRRYLRKWYPDASSYESRKSGLAVVWPKKKKAKAKKKKAKVLEVAEVETV